VRFVLNTHFHFDHTGGNENFAKAGSTIIAHDNTLKRLQSKWTTTAFNMEIPPAPKAALPVLTFPQALSLHLNGEDVDAIHLPSAHTDSDVALYFRKANVVHMGDVYPGTMYPFIDNESGGSLDGVIAAVDKILKHTNDSTRYIPGHNPLSTRAQLQEYHNMLSTVRKRISDAIGQGKTQEQVLASQPTKDFDSKFGGGFIKPDLWVQRAYVDLRRAAAKKS
jgi:cyclase